MDSSAPKAWYRSATMWGGIAAIMAGVWGLFGVDIDQQNLSASLQQLFGDFDRVMSILAGLAAVGGRVRKDIQPIRRDW